ncbi:MAG: hypothetical protein H6Q74_87 [Firmicutes bacterium]|nr:hypothetical protein [Bacillota bacterium]
MVQGFFLGLSTGAVCLAYCAPTLVPYILGEGKGVWQTSIIVAQFLGGRLLGYLFFAVIAWGLNCSLVNQLGSNEGAIGVIYIILAAALALYGLANKSALCAGRSSTWSGLWLNGQRPAMIPMSLGFLTGLNLCPPFLLALANASEFNQLSQSILFFFNFFLGTTVYFIPAPLLGTFNWLPAFKVVGKLAAAITAIYYLYTGIVMIGGGLLL